MEQFKTLGVGLCLHERLLDFFFLFFVVKLAEPAELSFTIVFLHSVKKEKLEKAGVTEVSF